MPAIERRRRSLTRYADFILVVASVGFALLVAEVGLRLYYYARTSRELARMSESAAGEAIDTPVGVLGPGVRLSSHPNVIYELRPNLRGTYDGRRFASNRLGFRHDREFAVEKPAGVRRIVGIGDSWMWGSGVDNGETYLDRLAEILGGEGRSVEVINTGVWGYNAVQQVATLRHKARGLAPDVVVIGLCGNDRETPAFMDQRPFVRLTGSFLWNEVSGRLGFGQDALFRTGEPMPFAAVEATYAGLAELARTDGFRVVVFSECFGTSPGAPSGHCALADRAAWAAFEERLAEWNFTRCRWDISAVPQNGPPWGHASRKGNEDLAAVLAACVRGLL